MAEQLRPETALRILDPKKGSKDDPPGFPLLKCRNLSRKKSLDKKQKTAKTNLCIRPKCNLMAGSLNKNDGWCYQVSVHLLEDSSAWCNFFTGFHVKLQVV